MRQRDATGMDQPKRRLLLPVLAAVCTLVLTAASATARTVEDLPVPSPSLPVPVPTPSLPPINPPILPSPSLPALSPPPLPTATPTLPVPTPSLPVTLGTPPPPPPPGTSPSPSATPVSAGGGSGGPRPNGGSGGAGGSGPGGGIHLPFTPIVISLAMDVALLGAFAVLPLLFGLWFLLFGRTWNEARQSRDAQIRLAIAHDLGLAPRELVSVTSKGLFKLREQAAFDELTGVLRRAAGIYALDREIARARRQKTPLSVAFIDVDGLKQANDSRGHKAGDELLRGLAGILKSGFRSSDMVLRYGGDEFVCVLPDTVADSARAKLSWVQTEAEKAGIRFSVGVTELERADDVVSLLGRADTEMYALKSRRGVIRDLRLGVVGGPRTETA